MFLKVFSFLVSSQNQLTFAASSICFWYFGTLGGPLFLPKMPGYCLVESASLFWSLYILGPQKWLVRGLVFSLRYIAHTLSNLLTTSSAILPSQAQIPFLPWLSQLRKRAGSRPALAASWCRGDKRAWTHMFYERSLHLKARYRVAQQDLTKTKTISTSFFKISLGWSFYHLSSLDSYLKCNIICLWGFIKLELFSTDAIFLVKRIGR